MIISLIYLTDVSYIWHMLWIVFHTLQYLTSWTLLYFIVSNIPSYIWHLVQTLLLFHCVKYMSIYLTRCQIWAHISDTLSAAVEEVSNICSYIWHIVSVEYMMSDTKLDQFILSNICLYISHLVVWCQIYAYIFDTMEKYCHSQFERCVRYMSLYLTSPDTELGLMYRVKHMLLYFAPRDICCGWGVKYMLIYLTRWKFDT